VRAPPLSCGDSRTWWGRGLAFEAAAVMIDFGCGNLGLTELRGQSATENSRVEKLVSKLGFRKVLQTRDRHVATRGWTHTVLGSVRKSAWAPSG
jgi:RimJ/RimL family protein N-acetyltransferase